VYLIRLVAEIHQRDPFILKDTLHRLIILFYKKNKMSGDIELTGGRNSVSLLHFEE
jgi:hypothetical protein